MKKLGAGRAVPETRPTASAALAARGGDARSLSPSPQEIASNGGRRHAQGIVFIIGPAVSAALYEWDKALPLWILAGLMVLLAVKFAIIPLRLPQLGDAGS